MNLLKRTVGQSFAAGGGLVDAQPVRQELSFVNLSSPVRTLLAVDGGSCHFPHYPSYPFRINRLTLDYQRSGHSSHALEESSSKL
ncbi:MAG: hypothetical protein LVT47_05530 [Cyanobacteria bacterium LVE1205-1]